MIRLKLAKILVNLAFYVAPKNSLDASKLKSSLFKFFDSVVESNEAEKQLKNIKV